MANVMRIGFLNINSLVGKTEDVRNLVRSRNCDIFGVQESKLTSVVTDEFISVPPYTTKRFDGETGNGGINIYLGQAIMTTKPVEYRREYVDTGYLELAIVEAVKNGQRFVVICAYTNRKSAAALNYLEQFCQEHYSDQFQELVIVGDLNHDVLLYPNIGKLAGSIGGIQTVANPTRGNAVLDVVIVGDARKHRHTAVLSVSDSCRSDHQAVVVDLDCGGVTDDDDDVIVLEDSDEEPPAKKAEMESTKVWTCTHDGCGKTYKSRYNLTWHVRRCHSESADFPCAECGKIFRSQVELRRHAPSHSLPADHPFHCQECGSKFSFIVNLQTHIATVHRGELRHQCQECPAKFGTASNLKTHIAVIHRGDVYQCQECPAKFGRNCNLQRHISDVHRGEKKYECQECGKRFASLSNLDRHHRIHTGEKPFECKFCGMGFTDAGNCCKHERPTQRVAECWMCYIL